MTFIIVGQKLKELLCETGLNYNGTLVKYSRVSLIQLTKFPTQRKKRQYRLMIPLPPFPRSSQDKD